jgi:glycosyltransferase EpsD
MVNKRKKVLFTATVDSHIELFHLPFLKYFQENGYETHVATNGNKKIPYADKKHTISFERSPLKPQNLKAFKQLKAIIDDEKFDIIHTHTPMGAAVTRLAARKARKKYGTRVIYTAHGFHFFKGAPLQNGFFITQLNGIWRVIPTRLSPSTKKITILRKETLKQMFAMCPA